MKLVTAQVVDGRIEVPPEIGEGSQVAILAVDDAEPPTLSPDEEQELTEALAEVDTGRYVDGWTLLEELKVNAPTKRAPHP